MADYAAMLTRREASTSRLSLGVLASLLVNIALKLHSEESKYTSAIASVYLDMDSGYLSGVSGVLGLDSGYLSGVGQVNNPSSSTYTIVHDFSEEIQCKTPP